MINFTDSNPRVSEATALYTLNWEEFPADLKEGERWSCGVSLVYILIATFILPLHHPLVHSFRAFLRENLKMLIHARN
jgi:hypothetical protein